MAVAHRLIAGVPRPNGPICARVMSSILGCRKANSQRYQQNATSRLRIACQILSSSPAAAQIAKPSLVRSRTQRRHPAVTGLWIWARIGDQRQRVSLARAMGPGCCREKGTAWRHERSWLMSFWSSTGTPAGWRWLPSSAGIPVSSGVKRFAGYLRFGVGGTTQALRRRWGR